MSIHSVLNILDDIRRKLFGKGRLGKMPSRSRQRELVGLMEEVIAQYRRLCAYREMTAISAGSNLDHIAEVIASLLTGVPGRGRKGKTETGLTGDLSDGTEVKEANQITGQIDFIVDGRVRLQEGSDSKYVLELTSPLSEHPVGCPQLVQFSRLRRAFNNQGCLIQMLDEVDENLIASDLLLKTRGKSPLSYDEQNGAIQIKLSDSSRLQSITEQTLKWWIRRERSWFQFGKKTESEWREFFKLNIIGIHFHYDILGRFSVAAFRFNITKKMQDEYFKRTKEKWDTEWRNLEKRHGMTKSELLQSPNKDHHAKLYIQPVLFRENERLKIVRSEGDGLHSFGAKLIFVGCETADHKFKIRYWNPHLGLSVKRKRAEKLLCGPFGKKSEQPNVNWSLSDHGLPGWPWPNAETREQFANQFFEESICGYLRKIIPYCKLTNHSFNIKFDETGEHLAAIVYGIRGTRTGARGGDLIENDGTESDVKVAAGFKGDALGTEDTPRYNLKELGPQRSRIRAKVMRWRRWIPIRILAIEGDNDWKLTASVQALNSEHMRQFHRILSGYQMTTMLNVNLRNEIFQPSITLGLRRQNDGLRTHNFLEAIRFTEGEPPVRGGGWDVAINDLDPCECKYCQARWVSDHLD
jgi:hypothetical protein